VICATAVFHRRLRYRYKATIIITLGFLIGCIATANMGLVGSGILFMVFSIILATLFFGVRYGIVLIIIGLVLLVAIAFGVKHSWIVFDFSIETAALSFSSWISKITAFALFSTILIFSLGRLVDYLVASSENLKMRTIELNTVNKKLMHQISEKIQVEDALRDNERKLLAIFNHHYQLTGLIDAEGRLLAANRTALRFAGAEESEVIGHFFWEGPWWASSQRSEMRDAVERAIRGEFVRFKTTHPTPNGEIRDIDFSLSPVRGDDGDVIYVVPEGRDITKIRQTEAERANLQEQLNQAQKMEAVGRLAGGVAHDFNNMLTVILGNVEIMMEDDSIQGPIRESLKQVHNAAERSVTLTRQLLAFARKQTVAPKVLDLNETLEGMLKMLRRLIGEDIDLTWRPGRNVWPIKMDPGQIDQLLANLCVNARDAIEGVGMITIETGNTTLDQTFCDTHAGIVPGEFVQLTVRDDGCGMDADTQAKIFEPFFTTKGEGEGTGLGLATVYGIVTQNEGFINVHSEPRHGTLFNIYIPRHVIEPGQEQPEATAEAIPTGHETILLVEDEPTLLQLATVMLESLGYRVLTSESPREALVRTETDADGIDLLVTDVIMPQMNGRELARQLKQTLPDLKCLFMSGYPANIITHHGVLDQDVRFLQKPFTRQGIAAMVREALDAR
jgi:PAS domain S-box-containing protein